MGRSIKDAAQDYFGGSIPEVRQQSFSGTGSSTASSAIQEAAQRWERRNEPDEYQHQWNDEGDEYVSAAYAAVAKKKEAEAEETGKKSLWERIKGFFTRDRAKNIGEAAISGTAAGYTGMERALYEAGQTGRTARYEEDRREAEEELARAKRDYQQLLELYNGDTSNRDVKSAQYVVDKWQREVDAYSRVIDDQVQQKATAATSELTHSLEQRSQKATEKAKEGLGTVGKIGVDAAVNILQMGGDALVGGVTGGGALLPMAGRVFGQGASEAQQAGASISQQLGYGAAAAGVEVFTEKLFDGLAGLYGAGAADEIVEKAIGKLARTNAGRSALRFIAGMGEEGFEEVISDILTPAAQMIYNGQSLGESYRNNFSVSDMLYDFIIGAVASGGMTAVRPISTYREYSAANAELRAQEAARQQGQVQTQPTAQTQQQAQQSPQQAAQDTARAFVRQSMENLGLSEEGTELLVSNYEAGETDAQRYVAGVKEAFNYGKMGLSLDQAREEASFAADMSPQQFEQAHRLGELAGGNRSTEKVSSRAYNTPQYESIEAFSREFRDPQAVTNVYDMAADTDVNEFAEGFRAAYDMGQSGVSESYLTGTDASGAAYVPTLTEEQRALAYEMGRQDAATDAGGQAQSIRAQQQGGKRRVKGTVKGEGVSMADLKAAFNDSQRTAYRLLTKYAEATGVNIVLYNSRANENGLFTDAQGRFQWKDDTIYIDINSGLSSMRNVNDLGQYTMMRTFAHEFTHFIEKWSPAKYNEFREFVFSALEAKGENVHDLIESKQAEDESGSLNYEQASREVVADAMMDILPDTALVQQLASQHQDIFRKLLQKLREFTARLKQYYREISSKAPREAQALKENGAYMQSIVDMWEAVARDAVVNYQGARGEAITETQKAARNSQKTVKAEQETVREEAPKTRPVTRDRFPANDFTSREESAEDVRQQAGVTRLQTVGRDRFAPNDFTSREETGPDLRQQAGVQKIKPVGRDRFAPNDLTSREETGERLLDRVPKKAQEEEEEFLNFDPQTVKAELERRKREGDTSDVDAMLRQAETLWEATQEREAEAEPETPAEAESPAQAQQGPQDTPEMAELRAALQTHNVVRKNGIEYRLEHVPGAGFQASVRNVNDESGPYPVQNARGLLYSSMYATRDEALDDIVALANNNGLLKPQEQPRKGSADAFANGDIFNEDRIRDAAGNKAATEIIRKMPEAPKTRASTKTSRAVKDWKNGTPSQKAAYAIIREYLEKGKGLPSKALYKICDDAFGGTQAEGTYDRKDAYDAMELAVNRYMLDVMQEYNDGTVENAQRGLAEAQRILSLLPTQNVRTQEQQDFQQFSTPPSIAYLTAWAAKISKGDSVLEPSAGIGGIATFAKAWGAEVTVNELSKRRLGLLQAMGFDRTFNENAEQIDNVLPDEVQPSVVVMNPPFSSTAGRTKNNKTSNAERHINQALERLNEGGRLVAVVGRGMADANYSKYWNKVREQYTIRANIGIDGENYKKYGTTFDVQIVVIDKTGPQGDQKTLTGYYKDLAEIPQALEGIRNDRNAETERKPGITGNQKPAAPAEAKPEPVRSAVDQANAEAGGERESDRRNHDSGGSRESGSADVQRTGGNEEAVRNARPDERGAVGEQRASEPDSQSGESRAEAEAARPLPDVGGNEAVADVQGESGQQRSGTQSEPSRAGQVSADPVTDDGVYTGYKAPRLTVSGAKAHPAVLVESAAMSAVDMPEATYVPHLPDRIIKTGALSDAQLVSVTYAGQAHEQKLPNGERRGFFVGDGTGVGKGRTICGIIYDNFNQGRKKAIWVTEKAGLIEQARDDWTSVTKENGNLIQNLPKKVEAPIEGNEGIAFLPYTTLRAGNKARTRIDQLVEWFGKDYDGVIVFDEAHNAGNLLGKKGKFGKSGGSQAAIAVAELQKRLPNARVLYCSATAATEVSGLAYASRLGLWGSGTAFTDVNDFVSKIGSSGLSAMELVIRDMKAMGMYVARSISYNGVEYGTIQHDLDPVQRQIYDTMSRAWQTTMKSVEESLVSTGAQYNSKARSLAHSQFYNAMQRFYNQVLTSMSMPSVIADMKKQLAAGKSCVLQIVNTNQAEADRQIASIKANGGELDEMDLTPRGTLIDYLMNNYPVTQYEEYTDDDGNTQSRPVTNSKGEPVIDKAAERKRDALIAEINEMSIPDGPLEMLFNAFGTDEVSEITGRKRRVVPKRQADGSIARVEEKRKPEAVEADVNAFQNGDKRILVFNNAGGTGRNYHADLRAKNQQQRIHYVLQPGWEASKAVQGFGRTHRSNEASAPIYKLVTTDIKGQKRFTSTIARRLDQLGALTKGQRDTGSGMFGASDNLETDLARDSLREFYDRLGKDKLEGIEGRDVLRKLGLLEKFTDEHGIFKLNENLARDISTFLNRILVLEVDEQNRVFDAFISIYEAEMDAAIAAGTLDRGMENVRADKIEIVDDSVIKEQKGSGAATHYVQAKVYTKPKIITTAAEAENARTGFVGIYRTKSGDVRAVYRMPDKTAPWGEVQKQYRLQSPNRSKSSVWLGSSLEKNAEAIPKSEWQAEWEKEIAKVPEYNEETKHMLTGALLPIWDSLPQEGNTKVQRLIADDGSAYLGRVIAPDKIDAVLSRFHVNRTKETFTAQQVFDKAIKSGTQFNLSYQRASIFRSKVSGEWRLEYSQPINPWAVKTMYPDMVMEKINWQNRYFIPLNDKGRAMLEKILEANPVANTSEESNTEYSARQQSVSNRELLQMAAAEIDPDTLGPGEKDALRIFNEALDKLQEAQERREELGRQYREQQFTKGGSREEAGRLLSAMRVLDSKIKSLENRVISLENKEVLKNVLSKARQVAEQQERQRGAEKLQNYRAKRNESEATHKYRERVRAQVLEFAKLMTSPSNKDIRKHVPAELQKTVTDYLDSIVLLSRTALATNGLDTTKADERYLKAMKKLHDAIKENVDTQGLYSGYADLPADFIENFEAMIRQAEQHISDNSGVFVINQMSAAELKKLSQTLKTLKKYIVTMNTFHNNAMFQHVDEAGESSIGHLSVFRKARIAKVFSGAYKFLRFDYMRPSYAFEHFGDGGKSIERELRQGQATQAFLANKIIDFAKKTYKGGEVKAWSEEIKSFTLSDGEEIKLPVTHIMSLYCLNKRAQALTHIYGDGIRVANYTEKGKVQLDEGHLVNMDDVQKMVQSLTPRQIEVADALQKYMSTECAEWGNYVSIARFDVEQFGEENYFPINSDGRYLPATADESPDNAGLYALLNMGFTKELKENASNRIILYNIFDVFANHTASMTQYRSFALPVLDALKWFNYKNGQTSVRDQLSKAFGAPEDARAGSGSKGYAESFVLNLLRAYNGTAAQGDPYDTAALKFLHRYNGAAIAYNARVVIQQPTAIARAAMILSPAKLTKGLGMSTLHLRKLAEEMEAHSGIAAWKRLGFYDTNISRGLTELIRQTPSVMDTMMDVGTAGAELADRYTWAAMWYAAKDSTKRSDYDSEEAYFKAVTDLFEDVIYKTQVVDSLLTKSEFLRSKGGIARQLGSFMSEPSATMSMLADAHFRYTDEIQRGKSVSEAWRSNGGNIAKTAAVYAIGQTILAAMQAVVDAWRDDDEKDPENIFRNFLLKYLDAFKGNVIEELLPFGKIPVVSEIYEEIKSLLDYAGVFDKLGLDLYGNDISSGLSMYLKYVNKTAQIIIDKLSGKSTNYTDYSVAFYLIRAVSNLTGLPAANIMREVQDVWNNTVGYFAPKYKLKTYERAADRKKREGYAQYVQQTGLSQATYNALYDKADADGDGIEQGEFGPVLLEAIQNGEITEEQAAAAWKANWNKENSTTFEKWRGKNGGSKAAETPASSASAPAATPKPTATPKPEASFDSFKNGVPIYGDKKQATYAVWESQLQGSMTLDRFMEILNKADADGNDSLKQDELGYALRAAVMNRELSYQQASAVWDAQGWSAKHNFDWWAGRHQ